MRIFPLFLICCLLYSFPAKAQSYYEQSDYGAISDTQPNTYGGYDYYSEDGSQIGYSVRKDSTDTWEYYDTRGNKSGALQWDPYTEKYIFYDANGVKRGDLTYYYEKGKMQYSDYFTGEKKSVNLIPGEDKGSLNPTLFNLDTLNTLPTQK